MTVRMRGFLILAGSLVAGAGVYWLLFDFLAGAGRVRLPAYPLALPLVGILIGTLELLTCVPRVPGGTGEAPRVLNHSRSGVCAASHSSSYLARTEASSESDVSRGSESARISSSTSARSFKR